MATRAISREVYTRRTYPVSSIVKEHASSTRYRAVSMVNGGLIHVRVAKLLGDPDFKQLKVGPSTLKSGMAFDRRGGTLENRRGSGRKTAMSRVVKIIVDNSALKQHLFNEETGVKTDCEAASRLQVGLAPLFAALPATEVAVACAHSSEVAVTETVKQPAKVML